MTELTNPVSLGDTTRVSLEAVTRKNFLDVIKVAVTEEQYALHNKKEFNPVYSMARSLVRLDSEDHEYIPRAIYFDGKPVGYFLLMCNPKDPEGHWISDFMIDREFQRRGIGTAAIRLAIEWIAKEYSARRIRVLCELLNLDARRFYTRLGFKGFPEARIFTLRLGATKASNPEASFDGKRDA